MEDPTGWRRVDSTPFPKEMPNSLENPKSCLSSHPTRVHATWKRPRDGEEWTRHRSQKKCPTPLRIHSHVSRLMPLESMPHGRDQGMVWRVDSTPFPKEMPNSLENPKSCLSSHPTRVHATWTRPRDGVESGLDSIPTTTLNSLEGPRRLSCLMPLESIPHGRHHGRVWSGLMLSKMQVKMKFARLMRAKLRRRLCRCDV